jgi:iron complex transport system substrate-binding protein/vitamin B12 transport system substrate-binding protein
MNVDTERVVALRPDLVAAWLPGGAARTLSPALTALHIPLIYSQPRKLDDIPHEILRFGRLLGTEHVAQTAAEQLGARIDALRKRYADRSPVRVFIEIGSEPLYTIGNDPLLNDVLKVCGGVNPYAGSRAAAPQVSTENVLVLQPDALVVSATDPTRVQARTQVWAELRLDAALHGKVYGLDPDELYRPGPRLVDAAEQLCADLDEARQPALER